MTTVAITLGALIREAKERARRRRLLLAGATVAVAVAATVAYTQLSESSPAATPACRAADYRMIAGGSPATGNLIGAVNFAARTEATCNLKTAVTMKVLTSGGALLDVPGNPMTWHVSGVLTQNHELTYPWRLGPLCNMPALRLVTRVAGGPIYRSTSPAASWKCDAPVAKQLVRGP